MKEREALKQRLGMEQTNRGSVGFQEALAQPEQEPVAWRGYNWGHSPDDWVYRDFDDPILDGNGNNVGQPLYTTPPTQCNCSQRSEAQASKPLTDEEIEEVWRRVQANDFHDCVQPFARAIEAKLKEKNT